ncbi:MAG: hypothetical protein Q8N53_14970 [Longimicrobiales bacterium]|nr:hypothetical protein [Longimicrobiales bacterium]
MRRQTLVLSTVLLALPCGATAQEAARGRAQQVLPAAVFQQVDALARDAVAAGIPDDILFNKALEGMAKRVPQDRLVPAVQAYAGRLREAQAAFGGGQDAPMLVAGADALQRGVRAEALRGLHQSEGHSPMAVLVLAELVETGVPEERALDLVREGLAQRMHDQEMLDMSARVRGMMRQGQSAQDATEQMRRMLQRRGGGGMSPPVPPGSEPMTNERLRGMGRPGGGHLG